ncbi:MAG: UDP-glucose 4-epimerase GalE [Bacteroidales bacterium]|nr:UDP-glucose 4-epimerase GalE [Bacteroidales bacterium]HOY37687.1 UDP-glucose 4-epimerase GalE [Bacteroidales bacterium]HQP04545.1 UDP-glucose 4-epimerase GalE [Bacteroidales bacterium]
MKRPVVLVTGGLGYIGSHTVVELQQSGFDVIIFDNLSNSFIEVLDGIEKITSVRPGFFKGDVTNKKDLEALFDTYDAIESVIHFAALKAVGESVENPLKYYHNNVYGMMNLLQASIKHRVKNFVFSSSCTVYGQPRILPVDETAPIQPESPYGNTKWICEEMLRQVISSGVAMKAISLRYFNPIGAHPSAEIGELPQGVPNNLMPYLTQTALGIRKELVVFGNNYNTADGTCIRDYIDINDLSNAHVVALAFLSNGSAKPYDVINLGTGLGVSVLEMIRAFEESCHVSIKFRIGDRRGGDVEKVWANADKALQVLGWKTRISLHETMKNAWYWERRFRNGETAIKPL